MITTSSWLNLFLWFKEVIKTSISEISMTKKKKYFQVENMPSPKPTRTTTKPLKTATQITLPPSLKTKKDKNSSIPCISKPGMSLLKRSSQYWNKITKKETNTSLKPQWSLNALTSINTAILFFFTMLAVMHFKTPQQKITAQSCLHVDI